MGRVIGIIISLVMIIGGLSGSLVLRGTDSSITLIVIGVIMLVFSILPANVWDFFKSKKRQKQATKSPEERQKEKLILRKLTIALFMMLLSVPGMMVIFFGTMESETFVIWGVVAIIVGCILGVVFGKRAKIKLGTKKNLIGMTIMFAFLLVFLLFLSLLFLLS